MRTLLFAALASACAIAPAHAGNLLDLSVVDRDTGSTLSTWSHNGKLYIAGKPGHRYAVRMTNRSGGRVMAVLSVDGVNAVTGETAGADQNGYVLDAWQSAEINGWRKSLDEIAQFNFTSLPNSYAARTGRPANVGVIGVAVFTERVQYEIDQQAYRDSVGSADAATRNEDRADQPAKPTAAAEPEQRAGASAMAGAAPPAPAARRARQADQAYGELAKSTEKLGTGHGAREWSRVATTTFERASTYPAQQTAIWYDSYANLVAQGIIVRPYAQREPSPFPNGFVADPPRR
ncbi:MAG: hypothetical protein ABI451_03895 [Dokdonella sp.]